MRRPRANSGERFSPQQSNSLNQRLNTYALAAGAAGVALLACSVPSEATPVCKNISFMFSIGETNTYALNPADLRIAPFNIVQTYAALSSHTSTRFNRGLFTPNLPGADVVQASNSLPADLASGAIIGPGGRFGKGQSYGVLFTYGFRGGSNHLGNLKFDQTNYFGYKFLISGKNHYGWVRIDAGTVNYGYVQSEVVSSGYETTPDTAILAGSCSAASPSASAVPAPQNGAGSSSSHQAAGRASAASPMSDTPRPASLGMLALGARGMQLWRR
jgi:hypothetical protein